MAELRGQVPRQENCPGAATGSAVSSGAYDNYVTANGNRSPAAADWARDAELSRLLNTERLATYVRACLGDQERALRLYSWNIAVASAFWGSFNVLEVALRNVIHTELTALAGREDWWHGRLPLHQIEQQRVAEAIATAKRAKGPSFQRGHVIAELNFGFWTGLLANRYHQRLWVPALHRAFPQLANPRRELHRKQESLRKLRNRIAHHEPIFARNLAADHDRLLNILDAISLIAVDWVKQNSRVPQILACRARVLAGTESATF